MTGTTRIPVFIPTEHHEYLRNLAHIKRTSMAEEIRNAVQDYVSKHRQEEKSKHIKIETINDPTEIRKQLHNRYEGGKIND